MSSRNTSRRRRPGNHRRASIQRAGLFTDLPELKVARALWRENKLLESCRAFEAIVKSWPANIPALIDASRAMGNLYRYGEAKDYLNRVMEVGVRSGKANFLAGQSYRLIRLVDQAVDCLQKAIEIDRNHSDVHLELAIIHERRNDLDKAREHAEARLGLCPFDREATFLMGRILRRQQQFDSALKMLEQVAFDRNSHWMTRSRAFSELASTHAQMGSMDHAWQFMLDGKELVRPHAGVQVEKRNRILPSLMQLAHQVQASDLENWQRTVEDLDGPRPVLLTGIPRSGTTLLGERLGQNPSICFADEFSVFPHICFPMMLGATPPEKLTVGTLNGIPFQRIDFVRNSYRAMFSSAIPASMEKKVMLDKNPSLLPLVIPYLRTFPHAKIIFAMRDPRDILVSCLMTYMPLNDFSVDMLDVETAAQRLEVELVAWAELKNRLPRSSWVEVRYEDVVANCRQQTEQVRQFLGLDCERQEHKQQPHNDKSDAISADIFSPSYAEVAQPVTGQAVGRWVHLQHKITPYLGRLEKIIADNGYAI